MPRLPAISKFKAARYQRARSFLFSTISC